MSEALSYQNITAKKAKDSIVDEVFSLKQKFGIEMTVRVWIPSGQRTKKRKRSYICCEGLLNGKKHRYNSHQYMVKGLRENNIDNAFDIAEYIDQKRKQICGIQKSIRNQYAQTPDSLYKYMTNELNLSISSHDPAPQNPKHDSLSRSYDWSVMPNEVMYVNPPFRDASQWISKLKEEFKKGSLDKCLMLLPARLAAPWQHLLIGQHGIASKILVPRAITFKNYNEPYPWGCCLYICERERIQESTLCLPATTIEYIDRHFK